MGICENKHMDFGFEVKSIAEDGSFAGYASVFNVVDDQRDIILPGAFSGSIEGRAGDIKLLWQHKTDEPIGRFTRLVEDEHGLFVEGELLLGVQRAQEAHTLLKSGSLKGMSIGYSIVDAQFSEEQGVRMIRKVDLWEISLVTFPANASAQVTFVKGEVAQDIREFEGFLRKSGYSRSQAKAIACKGFKGLKEPEYRDNDLVGVAELGVSVERAMGYLLG